MNNVKEKLILIEHERAQIEKNIDSLEKEFNDYKKIQNKIHLEVKKTSVNEFNQNISHFTKNTTIFKKTNQLIDMVQKLHLEKLVWINLSIIYAKIAPSNLSFKLNETVYSTKKRVVILSDILEDLTTRELYEYCSVISNQINFLSSAA